MSAADYTRLQIRPTAYRGQVGFCVSGHDSMNRQVRVFCLTRETSEALKIVYRYQTGEALWASVGRLLQAETGSSS